MTDVIEWFEMIVGLGLVVGILLGFLYIFVPDTDHPSQYRGAGTLHEDDDSSSPL